MHSVQLRNSEILFFPAIYMTFIVSFMLLRSFPVSYLSLFLSLSSLAIFHYNFFVFAK